MTDRASLIPLARAALLPAACVGIVVAYFAFHAVAGNAGLLAWQDYKASAMPPSPCKPRSSPRRRLPLARQVALLDPRHVDRDLADELVRRDLGRRTCR